MTARHLRLAGDREQAVVLRSVTDDHRPDQGALPARIPSVVEAGGSGAGEALDPPLALVAFTEDELREIGLSCEYRRKHGLVGRDTQDLLHIVENKAKVGLYGGFLDQLA